MRDALDAAEWPFEPARSDWASASCQVVCYTIARTRSDFAMREHLRRFHAC